MGGERSWGGSENGGWFAGWFSIGRRGEKRKDGSRKGGAGSVPFFFGVWEKECRGLACAHLFDGERAVRGMTVAFALSLAPNGSESNGNPAQALHSPVKEPTRGEARHIAPKATADTNNQQPTTTTTNTNTIAQTKRGLCFFGANRE